MAGIGSIMRLARPAIGEEKLAKATVMAYQCHLANIVALSMAWRQLTRRQQWLRINIGVAWHRCIGIISASAWRVMLAAQPS
jgi:hypothetical protein